MAMLDEYLASVQAEGMGTEDYNSAKTPDHIERFNRETEGWSTEQLASAGIDFIMGAYRRDPVTGMNTAKVVYEQLSRDLVERVVSSIHRKIANAGISAFPEGTTFND